MLKYWRRLLLWIILEYGNNVCEDLNMVSRASSLNAQSKRVDYDFTLSSSVVQRLFVHIKGWKNEKVQSSRREFLSPAQNSTSGVHQTPCWQAVFQ